jgi:hypothetical protein
MKCVSNVLTFGTLDKVSKSKKKARVKASHCTTLPGRCRLRACEPRNRLYEWVGLIAAKAAALRINMITDSCLIASRTASRRLASSHATSLLNSSLTHHLPRRPQPFPHSNQCVG